jgi:signal transduction histidine kinase
MITPHISFPWKTFLGRVVVPTVLTIVLFISAFFFVIIPSIRENSMDRKREMIRELTTSAWNILAKFNNDEQKGIITGEQAQRQAIEQIKNLHYGQQLKDYFWINDMTPRMIIHPYRTDLNGKDLSDYTDPDGKKVFIEIVKVITKSGSGYVNYKWQANDDPSNIVEKISYVKGFAPWGWVIGTGIYTEDVNAQIDLLIDNSYMYVQCSAFRQHYTRQLSYAQETESGRTGTQKNQIIFSVIGKDGVTWNTLRNGSS